MATDKEKATEKGKLMADLEAFSAKLITDKVTRLPTHKVVPQMGSALRHIMSAERTGNNGIEQTELREAYLKRLKEDFSVPEDKDLFPDVVDYNYNLKKFYLELGQWAFKEKIDFKDCFEKWHTEQLRREKEQQKRKKMKMVTPKNTPTHAPSSKYSTSGAYMFAPPSEPSSETSSASSSEPSSSSSEPSSSSSSEPSPESYPKAVLSPMDELAMCKLTPFSESSLSSSSSSSSEPSPESYPKRAVLSPMDTSKVTTFSEPYPESAPKPAVLSPIDTSKVTPFSEPSSEFATSSGSENMVSVDTESPNFDDDFQKVIFPQGTSLVFLGNIAVKSSDGTVHTIYSGDRFTIEGNVIWDIAKPIISGLDDYCDTAEPMISGRWNDHSVDDPENYDDLGLSFKSIIGDAAMENLQARIRKYL